MGASTTRKRVRRTQSEDTEFDSWVQEIAVSSKCSTCANKGAAESLRRLLNAMIRKNASGVSIRKMHQKVLDLNENYKTGYYGFRDHLYGCERVLYRKAKG